VVLGDLIDRGPDSRKVIELCMTLQDKGAVILKGNHEDMAVRCLDQSQDFAITYDWLTYCGGESMIDSYTVNNILDTRNMYQHIEWLKNLPVSYQSHGYTFVHAGLHPGLPFKYQLESTMLWGCEDFIHKWNGPEILVVGHTPVQSLQKGCSLPITRACVAFIDCGSFFSGKLTLVELPTVIPDLSKIMYCQVSLNGNVVITA
jgi:serine/threonine protein phosphatase 1